ncbi:putative retrovirus-related pol polyprotein from transposon opus [Trichonephila clavipes]|nr:putative retrovirus-related pol polyprotein from transposon opus [Trichonephila clavipes]
MPSFIHSDRGSSFMSYELKSFLTSQGITTSRTTPYNPAGNGQVERYNGIIWKTIQLALRSNSMKTEQWEGVIQTALHSIRSLLCTATNATPHERMFSHPRRSHNGCSIPTWLTKPGPVPMKNQMRANKYEPIV